MRAYQIPEKEAQFNKNLIDSNGKKWVASKGTMPNTIRLICNFKDYYYKEETKKTFIVLHDTAGIYPQADLAALSRQHVSVAYMITRGGKVYELFDPKYWSYHLGSSPNTTYSNKEKSSGSIGIEICNIGPLTLKDGILYDIYNQPYCKEEDNQYYQKYDFRGYKYYATFTDEQYKALDSLLLNICREFKIKHDFGPIEKRFEFHKIFPNYGIIHHSQVRMDKVDLPPIFDFNKISGR